MLEPPKVDKRFRWQFGLRQLMLLPLYLGVCLSLVRWQGMAGFVMFMVFAVPIWLSRRGSSANFFVLKSLIVYGVVSGLALPFLDSWWLGEIPPLAITQTPKLPFAHWLRRIMVTDLMGPLGLSQGSFSPDYSMARTYALAMVYLIPLSILLPVLWARTRGVDPSRHWMCALVSVTIVDFCLTLFFAGGPPGTTFY